MLLKCSFCVYVHEICRLQTVVFNVIQYPIHKDNIDPFTFKSFYNSGFALNDSHCLSPLDTVLR